MVLLPVLKRPHRVRPVLEAFHETTPGCRVLFIPDPGDSAERYVIAEHEAEELPVEGNYAQKVNAAVRATDEPLIFLGADDIQPHSGWLEAAKAKLTDGIGVVGTNDLCNPRTATGELSTHSLVTRWYADLGTIDEGDKLLHEGYLHEYVDDELLGTARHRRAYAHAPDSVVEHFHPYCGKAPMDDLYAGQGARMRQSRSLYDQRRPLWEDG